MISELIFYSGILLQIAILIILLFRIESMLRALKGRENEMASESFEESPSIFADILSYAMEKNLNCSITTDSSEGTLFAEDEQGSSIKITTFPITDAQPGEEDFEKILSSGKKAIDAFVEILEVEKESNPANEENEDV